MRKEVYWSRFATDFETRNNYVAGRRNIEAVQSVLADQGLTGKVLELGCGNGMFSGVLARTADHVWATDWSEQMVAVSKNRLQDLRNVTVEKADCLSLSYPDGQFDAVVMINLLHIIGDPRRAVRECRRVVKQGGEIVVISFTMEGMGLGARIGMIYRYLRTYGKPPEVAQTLTVERTRAMLEDGGFATREARLIGETAKAVFVRGGAQ